MWWSVRVTLVVFLTPIALGLIVLWFRSVRHLDALFCRGRPGSFLVVQTFPHGLAVRRTVGSNPLRGGWIADDNEAGHDGWNARSYPWQTSWSFTGPFGPANFPATPAFGATVVGPPAASGNGVVDGVAALYFRGRWTGVYQWSPPDAWFHGFGCEWPDSQSATPSRPAAAIYVPFAAIVPVAMLPWAASLVGAVRRRHRRSRGLCRRCDYDLRGSPGRCPECGTVAHSPC